MVLMDFFLVLTGTCNILGESSKSILGLRVALTEVFVKKCFLITRVSELGWCIEIKIIYSHEVYK